MLNHKYMKDPYFTNRSSQSGFTLLEMLIAVLIFSLALVSLVTISSRGISATNNALSQTTAQFLAQEGIEIIHSRRGDNFLDTSPSSLWMDNGLLSDCAAPGWCSIGAFLSAHTNEQFSILQCGGATVSTCPQMRLDKNTALYRYDSGDVTSFRRGIQITPGLVDVNGSMYSATVVSRVEWEERGVTFSAEAQAEMYDWFQ